MKLKIGYQGIKGSYSFEAATNLFKSQDSDFINFARFDEVFTAVENGTLDRGVIPLENSYAGRVAEIHNLFPSMQCYIIAEHILPVRHNLLMAKGGSIKDVKTIISHEQALMQCSKNIIHTFNHDVEVQSFSNTAASALHVANAKDKTLACIASLQAAAIYDLEVIKTNFADSDKNYTTFIVISKEVEPVSVKDEKIITSILFTVRNIPAAIYKAIGGFATNNVDLLKIESYIPGGISSNSAQFFLSFYGHPSEQRVSLAMEELGFFATKTKLLGYYKADEKRGDGNNQKPEK
jgi:prephenate dehydratase